MRFWAQQTVLIITGSVCAAVGAIWTALLLIAAILGISAIPDDAETAQTYLDKLFKWLLTQDPSAVSFIMAGALFLLGLFALCYVWSPSPIVRRMRIRPANEFFTDGTGFIDRPPPGPLTKEQEEIERFLKLHLDPAESYLHRFVILNAHYNDSFPIMRDILHAYPANTMMQEALSNRRNDEVFWKLCFKERLQKYNLEVRAADEIARHVPSETLLGTRHQKWKEDHKQALDALRYLAATPGLDGIHWAWDCINEHHIENL
jgi:hypothetical protein